VDDGGPAFQAMVLVAMKKVRDADGGNCSGGFDGGESGVIVDHDVGEQCFIAAAAAKIQCREVIESAGSANRRKQQIVFSIPERMPEGGSFGPVVGVPEAGLFQPRIDGGSDDRP